MSQPILNFKTMSCCQWVSLRLRGLLIGLTMFFCPFADPSVIMWLNKDDEDRSMNPSTRRRCLSLDRHDINGSDHTDSAHTTRTPPQWFLLQHSSLEHDLCDAAVCLTTITWIWQWCGETTGRPQQTSVTQIQRLVGLIFTTSVSSQWRGPWSLTFSPQRLYKTWDACSCSAAVRMCFLPPQVGDYVLFGTYIIQLYTPLNWFGTYYRWEEASQWPCCKIQWPCVNNNDGASCVSAGWFRAHLLTWKTCWLCWQSSKRWVTQKTT